MFPRPRRTARPVLGLRFSVEALGPPEMVPVEDHVSKFCKVLSLKFGHGVSVGFGIKHPFYRKERHHDRDA